MPLREMCAEPHHCPPAVRMSVLGQAPLFAGLDRGELEDIDARMNALAWSAGEDLYTTGQPAEHLYVIASGRAKSLHASPDGDEHVVDLLAPGDLFGGLRSLGSLEHTETVRAMTTTCALRLGAAEFRAVLLAHPQVAVRALEATAEQLRKARDSLTARSLAPVAQRVAGVLLRLADKFGRGRGDGAVLIDVPLSRADLASMAGSTPESVSRAMSGWRTAGIIDSGRRWTEVRDVERLRELADGA